MVTSTASRHAFHISMPCSAVSTHTDSCASVCSRRQLWIPGCCRIYDAAAASPSTLQRGMPGICESCGGLVSEGEARAVACSAGLQCKCSIRASLPQGSFCFEPFECGVNSAASIWQVSCGISAVACQVLHSSDVLHAVETLANNTGVFAVYFWRQTCCLTRIHFV